MRSCKALLPLSYRSVVLSSYDISKVPHEDFDAVIADAKAFLNVSTVAILFIDPVTKMYKDVVGVDKKFAPCVISFCAHTLPDITRSRSVIVNDASKDELIMDDPLVAGVTHLRFFAATPLVGPEGITLGALCIFDTKARPEGMSRGDRNRMRVLAEEAVFDTIMMC
jgi:GAF domain-containing protein